MKEMPHHTLGEVFLASRVDCTLSCLQESKEPTSPFKNKTTKKNCPPKILNHLKVGLGGGAKS